MLRGLAVAHNQVWAQVASIVSPDVLSAAQPLLRQFVADHAMLLDAASGHPRTPAQHIDTRLALLQSSRAMPHYRLTLDEVGFGSGLQRGNGTTVWVDLAKAEADILGVLEAHSFLISIPAVESACHFPQVMLTHLENSLSTTLLTLSGLPEDFTTNLPLPEPVQVAINSIRPASIPQLTNDALLLCRLLSRTGKLAVAQEPSPLALSSYLTRLLTDARVASRMFPQLWQLLSTGPQAALISPGHAAGLAWTAIDRLAATQIKDFVASIVSEKLDPDMEAELRRRAVALKATPEGTKYAWSIVHALGRSLLCYFRRDESSPPFEEVEGGVYMNDSRFYWPLVDSVPEPPAGVESLIPPGLLFTHAVEAFQLLHKVMNLRPAQQAIAARRV
jgi:hypothetical protein